MKRILTVCCVPFLCLSALSCSQTPVPNANSGERVCGAISDTPTEAYKRLYTSVKAKDTEKIKAEMSKKSQEFAESLAERQKKPVEEVYANGFTATTFASNLPEIRDERVKGCWAAVEVRSEKDNRWEDLPYVNEGGGWKLAVGEMFSGAYQSPGKSQDEREREASNVARGNVPMAPNPIGNVNNRLANTNSSPLPKYDGPQVEPLPKKK